MKIQITKNYEMFQKLVSNRSIKKSHLNNLIAAIKEDNQLCLHPIIVNKNFEVIDGQHRLEAAKALDTEIYFIQSETVLNSHLISCNKQQLRFLPENYIQYYAEEKNIPDYQKLLDISKRINLSSQSLVGLILGDWGGMLWDKIKCGTFRFDQHKGTFLHMEKKYKDFVDFCDLNRVRPMVMFKSKFFTSGLRAFYRDNDVDEDRFYRKLEGQLHKLKKKISCAAWQELLEEIYYHGKRKN